MAKYGCSLYQTRIPVSFQWVTMNTWQGKTV